MRGRRVWLSSSPMLARPRYKRMWTYKMKPGMRTDLLECQEREIEDRRGEWALSTPADDRWHLCQQKGQGQGGTPVAFDSHI